MALTVNEGTQTNVYSVANAGTEIPIVKLDVGAGTAVADFGGTIPTVGTVTRIAGGTVTLLSNLTNGTVRVSVGTVVGGTLQNLDFGTIDTFYRHPDRFATVVSSGTSTLGTIRAGVAGSAIYVTDLIVSVGSATDVEIGNGGTNLPLVGTLHLAEDGGAVMNFRSPIATSSGSALVYKQSANVPLTISCMGYID